MTEWTFLVEELPDNFVQVRTNYSDFLISVHPLIHAAVQAAEDQGYTVDRQYQFQAHSLRFFDITPPGAPRTLTFKYLQRQKTEYY